MEEGPLRSGRHFINGYNRRAFRTTHPKAVAAQRMLDMAVVDSGGPVNWDDEAGPLIPLAALPGQSPRRGRDNDYDRCAELWRTILRLAAEDLGHAKPSIRQDAAIWFTQPDAGYPITLDMTCEALGLDCRKIRRHALTRAGLL